MPHNLQERNGEVQQLHQLYRACAAGSGAVVLADGPVGCGKTALLRSLAEWAAGQGALCASATASPAERHDRLGLIEQLMTALRAAARSVDVPAADNCGVIAAAAAAGGYASRALLRRFAQAVTGLAERAPVLLLVDDVHVADEDSLACLRYLMRRIDASAVLVVLAECVGHERALVSSHAETLYLPYSHRIRLAPLSATGVRRRLADRVGARAADRVDAAAWHLATGGNPLLVEALADDARDVRTGAAPADGAVSRVDATVWHLATGGNPLLVEALADATRDDHPGTLPTHPVPGPAFRHAYLRCLHRAGPVALAVARAAAVLTGPVTDPALLAALLDEDIAGVRRTADDLCEAGLLADGTGFRTEAARSAVLEDLRADELAALRVRAAEFLHRDGVPARAVAEHLLAARGTARSRWQADVLRTAGHEALAAGDVRPAVDYLRRAAELTAGTPCEEETAAALAKAEWLVDPVAAARRLPPLIRAARTGRVTFDEARPVVEQLLWNGQFTQAEAVLRNVADRAPGARAELAVLDDWLRLVRPDPDAHTRTRATPAPSALLARASGGAGDIRDGGDGGDGADDRTGDRTLRGTRVDGPLPATLLLLACLLEDGRLTGADRWPEHLLAEPGHRHVPVRRALLLTVAASTALRRGQADEAGRLARAGLFTLTPDAWGIAIGAPLATALLAATEAGDPAAARAALDVPVPGAMSGTPFALPYRYALGRFEAARGRTPEALRYFERCRELAVRWGLHGPGFVDWRQRGAVRLRRSPRPAATAAGPAPLPELTESERRVGALAAAGRTNREIADLLSITVSTVEQHLTKVYRKLKVRRRADLPKPLAHFSGEVLHMVEESHV
ncbi:helix-turn-helix transcriptional regulator [Streptomyces shenzhenensis]|uniref:helix-turn-helix transcriptional regulator n=1 Tax=Streptomyces shenzhenensis TaxID=943815 RepID=UPI001F4876A1|nr:LuxR family transcriptional regulator [Streptomyces shenzhenensis]